MSDLISRQDARKAIRDLKGISSSISESAYNRGVEDALRIIKELPSAEPKREECEEREQGLCQFYAG